jgi:hypothetical protein
MASKRIACGTAITPAPVITRCSCSTSLATSNAVLCVPATCTALTAGTTCSSPSWRATRARSPASISGRTRPLQLPEVYESLEAERITCAIRLPANRVLQDRIGYRLARPVGRPSPDFAAHRETAAAATTSASMTRSTLMRSRAADGMSASECQGKRPDQAVKRRTDGRECRGAIFPLSWVPVSSENAYHPH